MQKAIQMQCRWFAASSEVAKTAFGHSQKHTAAIPLKVPSSLCGDPVDIILRVVSKNNSNAAPVVCRLFRGGKNRLRALANTYRGYPPQSSLVTLRGPRGHYPACGFKKQFKCSAGGLPPLLRWQKPPSGTRKNIPRLFFAFRGCAVFSAALPHFYASASDGDGGNTSR